MKTMHDKLLRSLAVFLSAVACLVLPSRADDPPAAAEPVELKTLRIEYRQRLVKARTPADELYRGQLRSLLERYKRAGNLDASVAVQAEMQNPDPTQPVPPDKPLPPDLAGIRSAYLVNAQRQTHPVEGWYRQQLQALERSLVQRGDIPGARFVRDIKDVAEPRPLPMSRPSSSTVEWQTPWGGRVENDAAGTVSLKGPGEASLQCAIAVAPAKWASGALIECEIRVSGRSGGVLLSYDRRSAIAVYWAEGQSWAVQLTEHGTVRKLLGQPDLKWKPGEWQGLSIQRADRDFRVRLDQSTCLIENPSGSASEQWGSIVHYAASAMEIRKIKVVTEKRSPVGGSGKR